MSEHDASATSLHLENGLFVLGCPCGWRSSRVRAVGIGAAWESHVAVVLGVWPVAASARDERVLVEVR